MVENIKEIFSINKVIKLLLDFGINKQVKLKL